MKSFEDAILNLEVDNVRLRLEGSKTPPRDNHWQILNEACMAAAENKKTFESYLLMLRVFAEKTQDYHPDAGTVLWRETANAEKRADDLWLGKIADNRTLPDQRHDMIAILKCAAQGGTYIRPGAVLVYKAAAVGAHL